MDNPLTTWAKESGAYMLDGNDPVQASKVPDEVFLEYSLWPDGRVQWEGHFDMENDSDELTEMGRKPVRYVRACVEGES